jgi:hypothetical protein
VNHRSPRLAAATLEEERQMTIKMFSNASASATAIGALALVLAVQSGIVEARERPGAGARGGAAAGMGTGGATAQRQRAPRAGGDWTRTTETQRTDNGYTRSDRWQGADGRSASRDVTVTRDREAGTSTRSAEWTRPDGRSGSSETVTTRTDNGFTRSTTATNAEGQTATRNVEVARDLEAGTSTRNVDYTTFDGRSGSVDSTATRTENGFRRETSGTLPNGESFSRSIVKECDKGAKSCATTVTNDGPRDNPGG